jgi:hypothetical protein
MKEKKKKEEDISSETPKKKKPSGSGRLSDMVESMQKRGSPLNAHRVATRYFDSFRRERKIPAEAADDRPAADVSPPTDNEPDTVMPTAVDSAVKRRERKRPSPAEPSVKSAGLKDLDESFTSSESRVYGAIYNRSIEKKAPTLRIGLKELRELTGLSDKTVRVAVHSLERKLALRVVESSLGIYGRKFRVLSPKEVLEERLKAGVEIDPTTKKVLSEAAPVSTTVATGVDTAISNALYTAIGTTVTTAIDKDVSVPGDKLPAVSSLYELYTGNKWVEKDAVYWERIRHLDLRIIETALILAALKAEGGLGGFSDLDEVLGGLGTEPQEGYLEQLREVWSGISERGEGGGG